MEVVPLKGSIAYFDNYCPNCFGRVDDLRLEEVGVCAGCIGRAEGEKPCEALRKAGILKGLSDVCEAKERVNRFTQFFTDVVGEKPWSLQVIWAKRVLMGRSFAIQAPTGTGKTTFGMVMAAFLGCRSYIILPTKFLVEQVRERLSSFCHKRIVAYTGKKSEKRAIEEGDFEILITTHAFLQRNIDILKHEFGFVFVDDVDSVLKNPKNVDYLFRILGLEQWEIDEALRTDDEDRLEVIKDKIRGVLVVSSATLRPRTPRIALFRRLLGFDIQGSVSTLREVEDLYEVVGSWEEALARAAELAGKIGRGIFMFVSPDAGKEGVERVVAFLRERGISAVSYQEFSERVDDFVEGRVQVAVGIAISTNALVRGVDLPRAVRAAIFIDVPKFLFPLRLEPDPSRLFQLIRILADAIEDERLVEYLAYLRRYSTMRAQQLDSYPPVKRRVEEICAYLEKLFKSEDFKRAVADNPKLYIKDVDGEPHLVVGDATSYIQASGRTSRLVPGGITRGLSIVLVVDEKAFSSLTRRVRYLLPAETIFKPLRDADLHRILEEVERSRVVSTKGRKELFRSALVVVESPNKARTISSFFGKPHRRWLGSLVSYEVSVGTLYLVITASVGHVVDLATSPGFFGVLEEGNRFIPVYGTIKRCSCGNQMVDNLCPKCKQVVSDKLDLIERLRRLAFEVDEVYIATDPDAEGEKIAWDLYLALRPFNSNILRAEFHEVTPAAFKRALDEKRSVDMDRVKAQIVRRVADRWVGFTLSQRLQRHFGNRNLSAGRVQTPVLGWVIERDRETKERVGVLEIGLGDAVLRITGDPATLREAYKNKEELMLEVSQPFEDTINPLPPYTTSELLRDASTRLKLSAEDTMRLAQSLFEEGYITYHRTDSTRVSAYGIRVAKDYIEEKYPGLFKPRGWGEGGAHECIRPTRAIPPEQLKLMRESGEVELDKRAVDLYSLIFQRFMASQMREAVVRKVRVKVQLDGLCGEEEFIVEVVDPGFTLISPVRVYDLSKDLKPQVRYRLVPKERPYTEGTLVEEMKRRGLGRPSTYAKIVQTIINRGYVVKRGVYLRSTPLGKRVYEYLRQFEPYTSEEFTRTLEAYMDEVEERKRDYMPILREIYHVRGYLEEENPQDKGRFG